MASFGAMRQLTAALNLQIVTCGQGRLCHGFGYRARQPRQSGAGFARPLTYCCTVFMRFCLPDHPAPSARGGQDIWDRWDSVMPSRPARTPRPSFGFVSDGRSPDLRVIALPTFPAIGPVVFWHRLPLTVAGAVADLVVACMNRHYRTVFPFHPDPLWRPETITQPLAFEHAPSQADLLTGRLVMLDTMLVHA